MSPLDFWCLHSPTYLIAVYRVLITRGMDHNKEKANPCFFARLSVASQVLILSQTYFDIMIIDGWPILQVDGKCELEYHSFFFRRNDQANRRMIDD
jgi:hypothetical protein